MTKTPVAAPALELRIYPNFSEVRTQVETSENELEMTFNKETWRQMISRSLSLIDLPFYALTQASPPKWLKQYEGQTIQIRVSPDGQLKDVILEQAESLLVSNEHGYFLVKLDQLCLKDCPSFFDEEGKHISFSLFSAGKGTLVYLTRGIFWQPRYILNIAKQTEEHTLLAYADITNNTEQVFNPDQLEIIAGNIKLDLTQESSPALSRVNMDMASSAPMMAKSAMAPVEISQSIAGEGFYSYSLTPAPSLAAYSNTVLPFQQVKVTELKRQAILNLNIGQYNLNEQQDGVCIRGYAIKFDQVLPAGLVMLREDTRFVGEERIEDTAAFTTHHFELGRDPEVSYQRKVKLLEVKDLGENRLQHHYEIVYIIKNNKSRVVNAAITESYQARTLTFDDTIQSSQTIRIEKEVTANDSLVFKFEIKAEFY